MNKPAAFAFAFLVMLVVALVPFATSELPQSGIQAVTEAEETRAADNANHEYEYNVLSGVQTRDPKLYLRARKSTTGPSLFNDLDNKGGEDYQSRMEARLDAGIYTIEATTVDIPSAHFADKTREIGPFTLTISISSTNTPHFHSPSSSCIREYVGIVETAIRVDAAWTADCPSQEETSSSSRLSRYYTFGLEENATVTIELESKPAVLAGNPIGLTLTCGWHDDCTGISGAESGIDIDVSEGVVGDGGGAPVYLILEAVQPAPMEFIFKVNYYTAAPRCKRTEVAIKDQSDNLIAKLKYVHTVQLDVVDDLEIEMPKSAGEFTIVKIAYVAHVAGRAGKDTSATENTKCHNHGAHLHQGHTPELKSHRNYASGASSTKGFPRYPYPPKGVAPCFWSDTWVFKIQSATAAPAPTDRDIDGPRDVCPTSTLSLKISDRGGSVSISPPPSTGSVPPLTYRPGTDVTLTASPSSAYYAQWTGQGIPDGIDAKARSIVVTMDADRTIHANFVPHGTLANLGFVSNGRELVVPFRSRHAARFELYASSGSSCRPGTSGCTLAATVTMGAAASDAKRDASFGDRPSGTYWVRGQYCASGSANASATTGPRVATDACGAWSALFGSHTHTAPTATPDPPPPAPTYRLTVEASPSSCGNVSGTGDYPEGRKAPIRASVKTNVDCHFTGWTGDDIENASSSSTEVTMGAAPKTVTANFTMECKLTMEVTPRGAGTTRPAAGSAHTYDPCEPSVRLEADAGAGYRFDKWSGNGIASTSSNPATVAMKAGDDKTVTAKFVKEYTLTVRAFPTSCKQQVFNNNTTHDSGDTASFRVSWKANCGFVGWSSGVTDIRTRAASRISYGKIVMSSDKTVTATLVPRYTLRASVSDSACGSVTGDNTVHDSLKKVTVTVRWNAGCRFTGWSAGVRELATNHVTRRSSGEVRMNSDWSITAGLAKKTYTLSVSVTKTARGYLHGSVTRTPWKATYFHNDRVTLRANATPGYRFVKWSGAASGTSTTARIIMNGSKTAKAHFELIPLPPCDPTVPGSCACPPGVICGNADDEDEGG